MKLKQKTVFGYRKNDEIEIYVCIERSGVESDVWVMPYEAQPIFWKRGLLEGATDSRVCDLHRWRGVLKEFNIGTVLPYVRSE